MAAPAGEDLLEVAVGTGAESRLAAGVGFRRCVGVDLSMNMLRRARRRLASADRRVWFCQADTRALPFRADSFDSLLNCYMLDLLPEAEVPLVLAEFRRVLRSRGRLVLVTMAVQRPAFQKRWMALYRLAPVLVGGCRPIDTVTWLKQSGWELEREQPVSQFGFRSELLVARPQYVASTSK